MSLLVDHGLDTRQHALMSSKEPEGNPPEARHYPWSPALAGLGLLVVLTAGLNKALLFRSLQYTGSDFYSFLEMTWSWLYAGRLLHDNVYGYHGAIHNFYGMLMFAPLTLLLGAYGLILGLVLVHAAAVVRVAGCEVLDRSARLMILSSALSPLAFFVFDNPRWGFHPELLYPPLALLLAVELLEGWSWRAVLLAGVIVIIKEDGAVVCAAVVLAHTAWRVSTLWRTSRNEAWRALRRGAVSLLVLTAVFLAGLALLFLTSDLFAETQATFGDRLVRSLKLLARTLEGHGRVRLPRLKDSIEILAALSLLLLLPLGRRLPKGLALFAIAVPPLVVVLLVSAAPYRFHKMLWAPRVATLMVAVVAALVFASRTPPGRRHTSLAAVLALAAVSWGGQLGLLHHMSYPIVSRIKGLASAFGPPESPLAPAEDRGLRCVAARLPRGLPVSAVWDVHPFFHRQSIVFETREEHAWQAPRLRIVRAAGDARNRAEGHCRGPVFGAFAVEAECELLPLIASCDTLGEDSP